MKNRINLLAPSISTQVKESPQGMNPYLTIIGMFFIISAVAVCGGLFALNMTAQSKMDQVQKELAAQRGVGKQMTSRNALISEKNQTAANIKKLEADRPKLSNYLDELRATVPATMFLTNLEIRNKPFEVTFRGISSNPLNVAQLERNLQESISFKDCVINSTKKKTGENYYEFSISITPEKGGASQ